MRSALKLVQPELDEDCAIADDVCNKQKKTVCPTLVQSGVNDKNTLTQIQLLNFALKAAKFNSRPKVITALTGVKEAIARKLYLDATGKPPPRGQMPGDPTFYTSDVWRHIESIWLLNTYRNISLHGDSQVDEIECILLTYQFYKLKFSHQSITFDRFFMLIRFAIYGRHINTKKCSQCDGPYLALSNQAYSNDYICPVCEHNALAIKQKNK